MQPQLIRKDGSTILLSDEQYQQVLDSIISIRWLRP